MANHAHTLLQQDRRVNIMRSADLVSSSSSAPQAEGDPVSRKFL
jgi:hypothetical protein